MGGACIWCAFSLAQRAVTVLEALCNGVTRYLRYVRAVWRLRETEVWVQFLGRRYDLISWLLSLLGLVSFWR